MVGMLKIVRTERVNQKLRLHFVAGFQALATFQVYQEAATGAARRLDSGLEGIGEAVERLQGKLKEVQHELGVLRTSALEEEAQQLYRAAEGVGACRLVTAGFESRDPAELRTLGEALRLQPGAVALLASYDGRKLSLVAACADETGLDANELLNQHLAPLNGRGGGDSRLAQGGCPAEASGFETLFAHTREHLGRTSS
jgi:alanyl-tRNA synthetase